MLNVRALTLVTMILAAASTRIIPHPWNFTAVGAMCLFGGAYFQRRWASILVPLAALLLSDVVLTLTIHRNAKYDSGILLVMASGYVLFGLTAGLGMLLRGRVTFLRVASAAIGASLLYFVGSNFCAWLSGYDHWPYTPAGLVACLIAGIPFAQNMFLANFFYSGVLFGGYELLALGLPVLRQPAPVRASVRR